MISFDSTMLDEGPLKVGNTRERHIRYTEALRRYSSDGNISVLLKVPATWSSHPQVIAEGLVVYPIPCRRPEFLLKAIPVISRLMKREHFDLVSSQTPFDDGLLGVWIKRRFNIPFNVQMRSSFLCLSNWIRERPIVYRVFNQLGKWVSHRADTIRVVSFGERDRLEKMFPGLRNKIHVLHPFVAAQLFSEPVKGEDLQRVRSVLQEPGLGDRPFILFVGRLVVQKNIPLLLQSFSFLCKRTEKAVLVIAGEGPLREQVQGIAKSLGLVGNVLWLGNKPLTELRGWYALARATVLPSLHEGLGKVIIESYLTGTPVVATPFVSAPELIRDGQTGFITKSFTDAEELSEKLAILLNSPDLSRDMGEKGKDHIKTYLLPDEYYMQRLLDIWKKTACAA